MSSYLPLSFIQEKIEELQSALFFSVSDSVLKISTRVVNVIKVDEVGQVWFAIPRPSQYIHEFDREFAAKLDFFRKGKDFYLKILGKAFIVTDPEEINSVIYLNEEFKQLSRKNEIVLLKVKISHADYFQKIPAPVYQNTVFRNVRSFLYKWLFNPQHEFNLSLFKKDPVDGILSSYHVFSN